MLQTLHMDTIFRLAHHDIREAESRVFFALWVKLVVVACTKPYEFAPLETPVYGEHQA